MSNGAYGTGYTAIWAVRIIHEIARAENVGFNVVGTLSAEATSKFKDISTWLRLGSSTLGRYRTLFRKLWMAYDILRKRAERQQLQPDDAVRLRACDTLLHGELLPQVNDHANTSEIANLKVVYIEESIIKCVLVRSLFIKNIFRLLTVMIASRANRQPDRHLSCTRCSGRQCCRCGACRLFNGCCSSRIVAAEPGQ
jgi:hypothetical protein